MSTDFALPIVQNVAPGGKGKSNRAEALEHGATPP